MDNRGDYSTLEVAPQRGQPGLERVPDQAGLEPYQHGNLPEYYSADAQKYIHAQDGQKYIHAQDGQPGLVAVDGQNLPEAMSHPGEYSASQYGGEAAAVAAAPAAQSENRIWGMKRKPFLIVVAVALVVIIGAVVGGVVGGTVGKHNNTSEAASSSTASPTSTASPSTGTNTKSYILSNSSLSALNWTDVNGNTYYGVFWQDKYTNLVMSLWDSENKTWELVNLTNNMKTSSLSVTALTGTPLAAVVRSYPYTVSPWNLSFNIALFFLNAQNVVAAVKTGNLRGATWSYSDLTTDGVTYTAGSGSQLAAWYDLCAENCTNTIQLFYEDSKQSLMHANSSNWGSSPATIQTNIVTGSGLATAVMADGGGTTDLGNQPLSLRLYYDSSEILQELLYTEPGPWYYASTIATGLGSTPPKVAATAFYNASVPQRGPISIINAQLFPNGSIEANYWNNYNWHGQTAPIQDGADFANFTAIAVQGAMQFFGLTSDTGNIEHFSMSRENPLLWTYVGAVSGTNVTNSTTS